MNLNSLTPEQKEKLIKMSKELDEIAKMFNTHFSGCSSSACSPPKQIESKDNG